MEGDGYEIGGDGKEGVVMGLVGHVGLDIVGLGFG